MKIPWPDRDEAVVALVCGAWAAFYLAGEGAEVLMTVALVPLAVVGYRRRPTVAGLSVLALMALQDHALGIPSENPGMVAALFVTVYGLGRYGSRLGSGVAVAALLAVLAIGADPVVGTVVFGILLFATIWTFGLLVRRRTDDAERAAVVASELSSVDPRIRAAKAVAEERARLAGDALAVIRTAVEDMQRHAVDARADLDPGALEAIQQEGRRATRELRRLLGLLRSESEIPVDPDTPRRSRPWRNDLIAAVVLGMLLAAEVSYEVIQGSVGPAGVALSVVLAVSVLFRRIDPLVACLVAILSPVVALATDTIVPYGSWSAVTGLLLAWSITTRKQVRARDYIALAVFAGALLLDVGQHQPDNVAMTFAIIAIAAVAGHLWAAQSREANSATALAASLRAEHEERTERAVRAERLRLARELHDVTSHSVGVMVLQAGAAAAVRETAPDQALDALRNVQDAGVRALAELSLLFGLLDAGAIGAAGYARSVAHDDLAADLTDLVARMRQTGLEVAVDLTGPLPDEPVIARTAYRIVQEALTNAARYAPRSKVDVVVRLRDDVLEVTVTDDGPKKPAPASGVGSGFGLVGLEERIQAHGGDFDAGPRPGGGFAIVARIPVSRPVEVPI